MFALALAFILTATVTSTVAMPAGTSAIVSRAGAPPFIQVKPALNTNKCMGVVGGIFANGSNVDMYVIFSYHILCFVLTCS